MISSNLEDTLAKVCSQKGKEDVCASKLGAFTAVFPLISEDVEEGAKGDKNVRVDRLLHLVPLYANAFIEDDDPEWRILDYSIEVGEPPSSLFEFVRQYDYGNVCARRNNQARNLYAAAEMDESDLELRQNLLNQFRSWKRRRRRKWNVRQNACKVARI